MNRDDMLSQLQQPQVWDVVIIGGGATGIGCAVDAASRGYNTLLVEQYDFAKGTSSRSTKLVHGGVRYLAQGNIKLVREALRERAYLLQNAPHVTSTMAFIVPVYSMWDKWFYRIGLQVYDWLSGKLSLGKTRLLNAYETAQQLPGITTKNLKGGILYYDGQFDDARLAIDLAKTAVREGAAVINYCRAESFLKHDNRLQGLVVKDILNERFYNIKAKVLVNATGVFADELMQKDNPHLQKMIAPSQGIHLVINASFFPSANALMIPKTEDGRVLFAVPWHNKVLLGTTDTPVANIGAEPKPLDEEIGFILHHANLYLAKTITRADVSSVYVGLRPLIKKTGTAATSLLSRDHTIIVSQSGLITVSGGKWTTYRKMAEDVINKAIQIGSLPQKSCVTKQLSIVASKIPGKAIESELSQISFAYSNEQVRYFVEEEMAATPEDILARRTRLLFLDAEAAITAAPGVAKAMALALKKDEAWQQAELAAFTTLANGYRLLKNA